MSAKIAKRRKTVHEIDDSARSNSYNPRISDDEEDQLIEIILEHWDELESKRTDKSLTGAAIKTRKEKAWADIETSFQRSTGVSLISNRMCVLSYYFR